MAAADVAARPSDDTKSYHKTWDEYLEAIHSYAFPSWDTATALQNWNTLVGLPNEHTSEGTNVLFKHAQGHFFVQATHSDHVYVYCSHYIGQDTLPIRCRELRLVKLLSRPEYDKLVQTPARIRYELLERK